MILQKMYRYFSFYVKTIAQIVQEKIAIKIITLNPFLLKLHIYGKELYIANHGAFQNLTEYLTLHKLHPREFTGF